MDAEIAPVETGPARVGEPAPRDLELRCRGWEQEGALRCLMNTLDPAVAEDSARLVVYGGEGRAARSWADYDRIVAALRRLRGDETLLIASGRPVAVLPSHPDAPRVLISTAMLVPQWSGEAEFTRLQAAGLTMFGQMTAASWFYIGTQGILGFTHETFVAVAARHFGGSLAGRRVLTAGLGGMGGAQGLAIANLGGRALIVEVDPERAARRAQAGWVDLVTDDYGRGAVGDRARRRRPRDRARRKHRRGRPAAGRRRRRVRRRHRPDRRPRPAARLRPGGLVGCAGSCRRGRRRARPRDRGARLAGRARAGAAGPARPRHGRVRIRQRPARAGTARRLHTRRRAAGLHRRVRAPDPRPRRRRLSLDLSERRSRGPAPRPRMRRWR